MLQQETEQANAPALTREEVERMIDQARAEWAERDALVGMTDAERADYALAQREAAIEARERTLLERELRALALEKLAERGLPRELADALPYTGEEACMNGLDKVERAFRGAVQTAVDLRLRGEAPRSGAKRRVDPEALSDADYYRLTDAR